MKPASSKPALEPEIDRHDIERLCVEHGLKLTGPRRVIIRVLADATDHPDVDELHRRANQIDPGISLATVYRAVRLFEQLGILARRNLGSKRARYEVSTERDHYHLVDVDSGRVIEFNDPATEDLMRRIAERYGFDLISMKIELFGQKSGRAGDQSE
jgi:Fur family transcriptional regulator, ferric uptake regulator